MDTFRVGDFAALLDVNPRTVRRWIDRGLLSYVQLPGGERRIPRDEAAAILRRRRGNPRPGPLMPMRSR